MIHHLFDVWILLSCSVCVPIETTVHNSTKPMEIVGSSSFMSGDHRRSVDFCEKFGNVEKTIKFTTNGKTYYDKLAGESAISKNAIHFALIIRGELSITLAIDFRFHIKSIVRIAQERVRYLMIHHLFDVWILLSCSVCVICKELLCKQQCCFSLGLCTIKNYGWIYSVKNFYKGKP